jgi:hypothetical protein
VGGAGSLGMVARKLFEGRKEKGEEKGNRTNLVSS